MTSIRVIDLGDDVTVIVVVGEALVDLVIDAMGRSRQRWAGARQHVAHVRAARRRVSWRGDLGRPL
jgi:hypothetical protein